MKMINDDPYAEVQMAPVMHGEEVTDKRLVTMADPDGRFRPLAGLGAIHGEDYALIPNSQVHDLIGDVLTRTGQEFKPVPSFGEGHSRSTFWDGKRWSEKWYCEEIVEDMPTGSGIALGVEAVNSYDGSHPVGIRFFAMHLLCSNQFYTGNMLGNFVFRHTTGAAGIKLQENVDDALRLMRQQADQFVQVVPRFKALCSKHVKGLQGFLELRRKMGDAGWRTSWDPAVLDELDGNGISKALHIKQLSADPTCYWNLLNAYTAVSTHKVGGFNGASVSERATGCILAETADPDGVGIPAHFQRN